MSERKRINLKKGDIILSEGEIHKDLYLINKGKVLAFLTKRTEVTPVAYFEEGDFIGELSFFDKEPRSANLVCLEDTNLDIYSYKESLKQFPKWCITLAKSITKKIRHYDGLLQEKGIRRKNEEVLKPLSIEDQRHYYKLLEDYKSLEKQGLN